MVVHTTGKPDARKVGYALRNLIVQKLGDNFDVEMIGAKEKKESEIYGLYEFDVDIQVVGCWWSFCGKTQS